MSVLGLPPMAPELKSISPFLQRADELQTKEPVMAYWCAYYAAQIGISLKAKAPAARSLLFELLAVLERMKQDVGPTDAVDIESVSSAYVENFALKVFGMADNEDRKGEATRSTAKKFLAAANFLEVLKIFPKTPISESSEEKIKYSKWKAADIAKAFREGRKPAPGPAGSGLEPETLPAVGTSGSPTSSLKRLSPPSPGVSLPPNGNATSNGKQSPPTTGKTSPKRTTPPPAMNASDIAKANVSPREFQPKTPTRPGATVTEDVSSPGSWSTAATPGTDDRTKGLPGFGYGDQETPTRKTDKAMGNSRLKNTWVSSELEGGSDGSDEGGVNGHAAQKRTVRFTPSTGGLTPPVSGGPSQPFVPTSSGSAPTPPVLSSSNSAPLDGHRRSSTNSPPKRDRSMSVSSSPTISSGGPSAPPAPSVPAPQPSAPPLPYATPAPVYASAPPPAPSYDPPPPQDLTPQLIAKAQKHCRFAISALDYEDADQARKELRAALAVLGG